MTQVLVGEVIGSGVDRPAGKPEPLWQRQLRGEVATLRPSVQQLVWAWLMHQRSEHTTAAYGRDLREWLAFCNERDLDPLTVTRGHGDAYRLWLERGRGLSHRSAARKLAAVSSWYTYLAEESVIEVNKFGAARRPEINREESKTGSLTESEARAFIYASVHDHGPQRLRTAAIIGLMLALGPRVAEVVSLRMSSLGYEQGMRTVRFVGKGQKIINRQLPPEAGEKLDAYLAVRGDAPGPLFVTSSGKPMRTRDVTDLVSRLARQAGVFMPERVTPHMLRHTFATLAEERGSPARRIQIALGHSSMRTTEIYLHAAKRLQDDPSMQVAKVLW